MNYGMDQTIVNNPLYSSEIVADLTVDPHVSRS